MIKDRIRWVDIKAILILGVCYIPAFIYRFFNRDIWLCSERKDEARDNGYWMYKYIKENHHKQKCYYVISKSSPDKKKIEKYKTIINWGSLKHYFIFIATRVRLSAHVDADTPNSRVTNFMDRHHLLRNKRVFLQHGITKDKISFGYYDVCRADLFTCGAKPEYEFCKKEFGYPDGNVVLTGFARYDGLKNNVKKQVLIMPTWRSWLKNVDESTFKKSDYYKSYSDLLKNLEIESMINNGYTIVFLLHSEMKRYYHLFAGCNKNVIIDNGSCDIQTLLNESQLLITDYSSVAFDFAYLKKPIIYYQFDYKEYRKYQHPEGYFDYNKNGFGEVVVDNNELIHKISNIELIKDKYNKIFSKRVTNFFAFFDDNNCLRIFNAIKRM